MGQITSSSDLTGYTVGGILLGAPAVTEGGVMVWDHEALPDTAITVPPPDQGDELLLAILGGSAA